MSPWNDRNRSMWLLYTGLALAVVGLVTGYLRFVGVIDRDGDDDDGGTSPTSFFTPPPTTPTDDGPDPLEVVSWGRSSGQLALVVRNETGGYLARARVRIVARDHDGRAVLRRPGAPHDVCCTVLGLPAGGEFGLFAPLTRGVGPIASVEVEAMETEGGAAPSPMKVAVRDPGLMREPDDTIATAVVTARGDLSGYIAVQAILTDPRGDVAQVISGRFYCFRPGRPREVRLHLFHAVPGSLRLERIVAHPIPHGVPPHVPGRCD